MRWAYVMGIGFVIYVAAQENKLSEPKLWLIVGAALLLYELSSIADALRALAKK